tara:strand:- start:114872 stop:115309 length:438 start_codon:yes stop_codon:yes gene_type:complete
MRKIFFFLGLSMFLMACNQNGSNGGDSNGNSKVDELKGEVMKIHDVTMAKKGDIQSLLSSLKIAKYSTAEDSTSIQEAYKALKSADESMMTWMHEFKQPDEQGWTAEEQITYLEGELNKMTVIGDNTEAALVLANSTLGNLNSGE